MLRRFGHYVLPLIFVIISCFGLLYGRSLGSNNQQLNDTSVSLGGPDNVNMVNFFTKGIPVQRFRESTKNTTNFRDLYRIFLNNKKASDEEIDKMLTTRPFGGIFQRPQDYDYEGEDYDFDSDVRTVADEAVEHYLSVKAHPLGRCHDPTPEIRHIPPEGNKLFFPEYTILHVCRNNSGCCWDPTQECAEKEIEIVSKPFIVTELQQTDQGEEVFVPDANKVEIKFFKNVTRCGCKDLTPLPKCEKKCPFPFTKIRPGTECKCDCRDDTRICFGIKYGIEPLSKHAFNCILDGTCMKPQCQSGEFDMRKGYCSGTTDARLKLHFRNKRDALPWKKTKENFIQDKKR